MCLMFDPRFNPRNVYKGILGSVSIPDLTELPIIDGLRVLFFYPHHDDGLFSCITGAAATRVALFSFIGVQILLPFFNI